MKDLSSAPADISTTTTTILLLPWQSRRATDRQTEVTLRKFSLERPWMFQHLSIPFSCGRHVCVRRRCFSYTCRPLYSLSASSNAAKNHRFNCHFWFSCFNHHFCLEQNLKKQVKTHLEIGSSSPCLIIIIIIFIVKI